MISKPLYHVPSMRKIRNLPWNGFNVISTFSGCGGSSLGYKMAGFKVLWASEFVPAAQKTYQANFTDTVLDHRDIRNIKPDEILEAIGLETGELDVMDGSPPCASFSTAGKRESGWGMVKSYSDTHQRTDDLFFEYARVLKGIQPKVFVAENVSGLVKGTAKGYFLDILKVLKKCGYRVRCQLLDAQWLGVPQARVRTIFIGVRKDLGVDPVFPKPLSYRYTVRDAIPWIERVVHDTAGEWGVGNITDRPSPTITVGNKSSNSRHFIVEAETDISRFAIGSEWDKIHPGMQSRKYFNLIKPALDAPCPCVTQTAGAVQSAAGVVHPTEKRKFSIAELRRICSFPDDFKLTGTYAQQWERLGRAVPPVMMSHVAVAVRDEILRKL